MCLRWTSQKKCITCQGAYCLERQMVIRNWTFSLRVFEFLEIYFWEIFKLCVNAFLSSLYRDGIFLCSRLIDQFKA